MNQSAAFLRLMAELADFFRYNAHFAAQIYETQPPSPPGEFNYLDQRGLEGFVLAITPFNFTAIGGNLPTTAALMGNTVVWKPSEKAALSNDVVMRVLEEAGLPPGVINLVHGSGADVAGRALADENFAGVSFTGSTAVFRDLWKKIGNNIDRYRNYPRIVGETGGKNAVVAHPSADPDALLVALVRGAFEYQGQKCSAASRAYLPRSLWKGLEGRLADTVGALEVGDVARHETFVGAVIDETALRRLESTIDTAKDLPGHRVLTGGTVRPESGWFVDPTVFVTDDPTSFLMSKEFFGPLLTVHVYDDADWDKVLHQVDTASEYALTCSIFASERRGDRHRAGRPARHRRHDLRQRQAHRCADRPPGLRRGSRVGHQRQGRLAAGPAAVGQRPLREGELRAVARLDIPVHGPGQ